MAEREKKTINIFPFTNIPFPLISVNFTAGPLSAPTKTLSSLHHILGIYQQSVASIY
jgi:hypothetical protein